jgi:hypothetical protein
MDNQHRKIKGYRELSQEEIGLMNRIKVKCAELMELHAEVAVRLGTDAEVKRLAVEQSQLGPSDFASPEYVEWARFQKGEPFRWLAIGKTDIETGIMALVRAVAQPD